jgi:hypothetical protein
MWRLAMRSWVRQSPRRWAHRGTRLVNNSERPAEPEPMKAPGGVRGHLGAKGTAGGKCRPPGVAARRSTPRTSTLLPRQFHLTATTADSRPLLPPPLAPACARYRFASRARRAASARHGVVVLLWLRPGEGGAHCAEPPSQRQARCASRSVRPPGDDCWIVNVTVTSGSRLKGAGRIGSKRLGPGALTTRPALPAGRGPPKVNTRLPLPPHCS